MFKSLEIRTWRQIEDVRIDFHKSLTILTGANGSGKTTILNLLSRHFGWSIPLVGTPRRDRLSGVLRYFSDFWKTLTSRVEGKSHDIIGEITYENSQVATLSIPSHNQTFVVDIKPQLE